MLQINFLFFNQQKTLEEKWKTQATTFIEL